MRISELAKRTGTSISTLKYYLREGLLAPGDHNAPNQAEYTEAHVHRVQLLRALTEVGGLSLRAARRVLAAAEDTSLTIHEVFGVAQQALHRPTSKEPQGQAVDKAQEEVSAYLRKLGWRLKRDAPARRELAGALLVLRDLGWQVDARVFDPYARVADEIARWEIEQIPPDDTPADKRIENVVVGSVVFEVVLAALRRLAEEHHSAVRFADSI